MPSPPLQMGECGFLDKLVFGMPSQASLVCHTQMMGPSFECTTSKLQDSKLLRKAPSFGSLDVQSLGNSVTLRCHCFFSNQLVTFRLVASRFWGAKKNRTTRPLAPPKSKQLPPCMAKRKSWKSFQWTFLFLGVLLFVLNSSE